MANYANPSDAISVYSQHSAQMLEMITQFLIVDMLMADFGYLPADGETVPMRPLVADDFQGANAHITPEAFYAATMALRGLKAQIVPEVRRALAAIAPRNGGV